METKLGIGLEVDKNFDCDMGVFEALQKWPDLKNQLQIPDGFYFLVGELCYEQRKRATIHKGIFVQGYVDGYRRYEKIIVGTSNADADSNHVYLHKAKLYYAVDAKHVAVVFSNGGWRKQENIEQLFSRICEEKGLEPQGGIGRYEFNCEIVDKVRKLSWYYRDGETYEVWMMLVKNSKGKIKALLCDFNSGIPGMVTYEEGCYKPV